MIVMIDDSATIGSTDAFATDAAEGAATHNRPGEGSIIRFLRPTSLHVRRALWLRQAIVGLAIDAVAYCAIAAAPSPLPLTLAVR